MGLLSAVRPNGIQAGPSGDSPHMYVLVEFYCEDLSRFFFDFFISSVVLLFPIVFTPRIKASFLATVYNNIASYSSTKLKP